MIPIRDEANPKVIFEKKFRSTALKYPTPKSRKIPNTFDSISAFWTLFITKKGLTTINPAADDIINVPTTIVMASCEDNFSLLLTLDKYCVSLS